MVFMPDRPGIPAAQQFCRGRHTDSVIFRCMQNIAYARYRFPPVILRHAVFPGSPATETSKICSLLRRAIQPVHVPFGPQRKGMAHSRKLVFFHELPHFMNGASTAITRRFQVKCRLIERRSASHFSVVVRILCRFERAGRRVDTLDAARLQMLCDLAGTHAERAVVASHTPVRPAFTGLAECLLDIGQAFALSGRAETVDHA